MIDDEMPDRDYFALEALSNSGIKQMMVSPLRFKSNISKSSPEMRVGTVVHALLLDPDKYESDILVFDGASLNSAAAKDFVTAHPLRTVVSRTDDEKATDIVSRHSKNTILHGLLNTERKEFVIRNNHVGVPSKCKIDFYKGKTKTLGDIKTCGSLELFKKNIFNFGYHIQAAWYTRMAQAECMKVNRFLFVALETSEPFDIGFFQLDEDAYHLANRNIDRIVPLYKECLEKNEWPGQKRAIETVATPGWLLKDL